MMNDMNALFAHLDPGLPLAEASAYFLRIKHAYEEPDTTGVLEGMFTVPVEEALQMMGNMVQNEMKTMYAYMIYANSLRDLAHHAIAEEFEAHADVEREHADFLLRRMGVLGGAIDVPEIPAPPASTDPVQIIKTMLRMEQEGTANWKALHEILGDNPMKFKVEEYLANEQEHIDELWQLLPHEAPVLGKQANRVLDALSSAGEALASKGKQVAEDVADKTKGVVSKAKDALDDVRTLNVVHHGGTPDTMTHKVDPAALDAAKELISKVPTSLTHNVNVSGVPKSVEHTVSNATLAKALGGTTAAGGSLVGLHAALNRDKEASDEEPSNLLQSFGKWLGDHPRTTSSIAAAASGALIGSKASNPVKGALAGAALGGVIGAGWHDVRKGMRLGKQPDPDHPEGIGDIAKKLMGAGSHKNASDEAEAGKSRARSALHAKHEKDRLTLQETHGDISGRILGAAAGLRAAGAKGHALERVAAAVLGQHIGGRIGGRMGSYLDEKNLNKKAHIKRALLDPNYVMQEQAAAMAVDENEQRFYQSKYQEAQQQAQALQAQQQQLQQQLQAAQQQVQQSQQVQDAATQNVQAAIAAMTSANQRSMTASSELIGQKATSTATRDAMLQMKSNLQEILNTPVPSATSDEQAQTGLMPGLPPQGPPQGPQQGSGAAAEPGAAGAEAGGMPQEPQQGLPPDGGPAGQIEQSQSPPEQEAQKTSAVNHRLLSGLLGGAMGAGLAQNRVHTDLEPLRGDVKALEDKGDDRSFFETFRLVQKKTDLATSEAAQQHPFATTALSALIGGASGQAGNGALTKNISRAFNKPRINP